MRRWESYDNCICTERRRQPRSHSGRYAPRPFHSVPMRQVVESFLTYRHIENAPVDLAVVATDLATGKPVVLDSGDVTTALHSKKRSPSGARTSLSSRRRPCRSNGCLPKNGGQE